MISQDATPSGTCCGSVLTTTVVAPAGLTVVMCGGVQPSGSFSAEMLLTTWSAFWPALLPEPACRAAAAATAARSVGSRHSTWAMLIESTFRQATSTMLMTRMMRWT